MRIIYKTYRIAEVEQPTEMDPNGALQDGMYVAAVEKLPTRTVVATRGLNVRKGPGTAFAIIGAVMKDQKVTIYEQSGEWARIADPFPAWVFTRQLAA